MSGTMSSAMRFEDHFGPIVPAVGPASEPATDLATPTTEHASRLRDLVEQMRLSVVTATTAADPAEKVELWESYRAARAEALAVLASHSAAPGPRRLRSV